MFLNDSKGDYSKIIDICNEAEAYLRNNPIYEQRVRLAELAMVKMNAYVDLRDYDNGFENAEKCMIYFTPGSNNWLVFLEAYFLLAMHSGNSQKAWDIYNQAVNHPRFAFSSPERQEKWKIFEAFIYYSLRDAINKAKQSKLAHQAKFRIEKFLNEVPIASKDKRGYNVLILSIQIMFLLNRGDFEGIINRAEALKTYRSRYLKKDEDFRSNCFIKMLLIMEKKSFDYEDTKRLAQKYHEKLKNHQIEYEGTPSMLEVIPFERLWEHVLEDLKRLETV